MILLAALAHAEEPAYERLFGAPPPEVAVAEPAPRPSLAVPAAVGVAGLGLAFWLRRRVAPPSGRALVVLQREVLGERAALVLVEVTDAEGDRRRLLIGTGPAGAPALVADLGHETAVNVADEILAERAKGLRRAPAC